MQEKHAPYRLAISHSSADIGMARMLEIIACKSGAECFADFKIQGGRDFRQEIVAGIQEADELAVLITPHFVKSPWLHYEAGLAEGGDVLIVPLVYRLTPNDYAELPFMGRRQAIHIDNVHTYVDELKARIKRRESTLRRAAELAAGAVQSKPSVRPGSPADSSIAREIGWPARFRLGSNRARDR